MAEYKYLIFFTILLLGVPIGALIGSRIKVVENLILFLAVFFSCRLNESINFISHETYRGTSRGFEVTLVDLSVLTLFLITFAKNGWRNIRIFPPGTFLYFLYFIVSCLSISNASFKLYSYFEVFKMCRMYFVYWVFFNYLSSIDDVKVVLKSIWISIIYIFTVVIWDKYIGGVYQARGPFPHQNSLVMYLQFCGGLSFAIFLNAKKSSFKWAWATILSGMIVMMTLSRGGMLCFAISWAAIYSISLINKFEIKKLLLAFYILVASFLILLKSYNSIYERFTTAPKESAITRVYLAKSAINMANDNIFGIGLNNFGLKVNKPYQYSKDSPRFNDKNFKEGLVETTYLMIAAETGWINLIIFLMYLMSFYLKALKLIYINRDNITCSIFIGIFGGMTGVFVESTLEWVLKQTPNFYQLMIMFSIVSAFYIKKELKDSALSFEGAL